jgi:NAD+ synthase
MTDPNDLLRLDPEATVEEIASTLRSQVADVLGRRGAVVGMSGGVDSSVSAALAVRAFGPRRVLGLFMPERDSDSESLELAGELAAQLGIETAVEDVTGALEALRCYERRDEAIRRVLPDYGPGWRAKIVLPGARFESDLLNVYYLAARSPDGTDHRVRLSARSYLEIVAATNFKQRVRKTIEYHHADRLHYAVVGTPNRLEYDQGFFVKGGDGLADVKPIAHLYKTQVYQLARHLGVPCRIVERAATTDTYSLPQTQEEFYFSLPAAMLDLVLFARNAGWTPAQAAARLSPAVSLSADQIARAYDDIDQKRATTAYLHTHSLLVPAAARGATP